MRTKKEIETEIIKIEENINHSQKLMDEATTSTVFDVHRKTRSALQERLHTLKWVLE